MRPESKAGGTNATPFCGNQMNMHNLDSSSMFELHVSFVTRTPEIRVSEERMFDLLSRYARIKMFTFKKFSTHNPTGNQSGYGFAAYDDLQESLLTMSQIKDSLIDHISFDCHLSHRSMQKLSAEQVESVKQLMTQLEERKQQMLQSEKVALSASLSHSYDSDLSTQLGSSNASQPLQSPSTDAGGHVAGSSALHPSQYVSYYNSMMANQNIPASHHAMSSTPMLDHCNVTPQHYCSVYPSNSPVSSPQSSNYNATIYHSPSHMVMIPINSSLPASAAYCTNYPTNYPVGQCISQPSFAHHQAPEYASPYCYSHHHIQQGISPHMLQEQQLYHQLPYHYPMMAMPMNNSSMMPFQSGLDNSGLQFSGANSSNSANGFPVGHFQQQQRQSQYPGAIVSSSDVVVPGSLPSHSVGDMQFITPPSLHPVDPSTLHGVTSPPNNVKHSMSVNRHKDNSKVSRK